MDYDEGCWMMVMVMVMIVDIVFSSISWGRELRRSPWRALAGIFIEHIHPSRSSSIRNPTLCRTRLRPPSVRTPKGRIPKLKAGGVFPVDTIAATLCWRTSSREKIQRLIRFIVMVMIIIHHHHRHHRHTSSRPRSRRRLLLSWLLQRWLRRQWGIACVLTLETLQPLADCTTRFSALGNSHSRR